MECGYLSHQTVRENKWRKFDRIFSDGSQQVRYIREIIFGKKRIVQYWLITTDSDKLPENSTWYVSMWGASRFFY